MSAMNYVPACYIISETKLNEDVLRRFLKDKEDKEWEKKWFLKNKDKPISDAEKLCEVMADFTEMNSSELSNEEFIRGAVEYHRQTNNTFFNHVSVSVLFQDVSLLFLNTFLKEKFQTTVHSQPFNVERELSFWLPPHFQTTDNAALAYGEMVDGYDTIRQKLLEEVVESFGSKNPIERKRDIESVSRLFPMTSQINCGITAGLGEWMDIILNLGSFYKEDETRYIATLLLQSFKEKYSLIFQEFKLQDKEGNLFGIDSLKSSQDAWQNFQIVF